jgi:hypothetical protein
MFEETVLRFADKDRQRELAEREEALAERERAVAARRQNLNYRQQRMAKDPHSVRNALEVDRKLREEEKRSDELAQDVKKRFGIKDNEMLDTAAMRGALEQALAEKDVEQTMRAERITDRASLIDGINKLAMIDAKKAHEILHANKELKSTREWTLEERAKMFANALSWKDDRGASRNYPKTLDGWAKSIAERERALELAEAKLDSQEAALRTAVERKIASLEQAQQENAQAQQGIDGKQQEAPSAKLAEHAALEIVSEGVGKSPADRAIDLARAGGKTSAGDDRQTALDTSLETLRNPEKFAALAKEYAERTGISLDVASKTLNTLRETKERGAGGISQEDLDRARQDFFSKKKLDFSLEALRDPQKFAAAVTDYAVTGAVSIDRATRVLEALRKSMETRAATNEIGATERRSGVLEQTAGRGVEQVKNGSTEKVVNMDAARRSSMSAERGAGSDAAQDALGPAGGGISGFRTLGRNKTRDVAQQSAEKGETQSRSIERVETGKLVERMEEGSRKRFSDLTPEQKQAKREQFMGDVRERAGFSRDGKEAVSERTRETLQRGKERSGRALGA